jgi:hypothetical protein
VSSGVASSAVAGEPNGLLSKASPLVAATIPPVSAVNASAHAQWIGLVIDIIFSPFRNFQRYRSGAISKVKQRRWTPARMSNS